MNAYFKDIFREIVNTKGRFLSLIIITVLGAASVVGIQAAAIDMRDVADKLYKERALYDLQVKSPTGFNSADITALQDTDGVQTVMPAHIVDVYLYSGNEAKTVRTYSLPDELNKLELLSGRFPENASECVVERRLLGSEYEIGDTISLGLDNMYEYDNFIEHSTLTIVGTVLSPLYINKFERGQTTLGNGRLDYYLYLHPTAYKLPVYTDVYLQMQGTDELYNLSDDYDNTISDWQDTLPSSDRFYFTRKDGVAYDSYYQDTLRLEKIGYVFPLVFFLVAVMVSLTTMTRMVEEHRTQIGIYKALGYSAPTILAKYLIYAFSAGIIGGITGVIAGSYIFPKIITDAYSHMYDMPPVATPVPLLISAAAIIFSVGSVALVTLLTCAKTSSDVPAMLMRPEPPKSGKRVLIERITFIWNRLSFIGKVTARNIFRYKKRFFMTLTGVAGCSALLLTAFGLRDSIGGVAKMQFERIVKYDAHLYLKEITTAQQRDSFSDIPEDSQLFLREESVKVSGDVDMDVSLIVPESAARLTDFVNLFAPQSDSAFTLDAGSVIITEKLSQKNGITAGSDLTLTLNGVTCTVPVSGVAENYILNYIYMPPELYETLFDAPIMNALFIRSDDALIQPLLSNENVRAIIHTKDQMESVSDSTDALGIVTIVLIVLACALALVVLFNLTNINITERIRELATIKVLGFYDSELAMYIYRENAIVTSFGILSGLVGGIFLHRFILTSIEVDLLMFPIIINLPSFLYSVILSTSFAIFVNLIMNLRLSSIDMVTSLKSVE